MLEILDLFDPISRLKTHFVALPSVLQLQHTPVMHIFPEENPIQTRTGLVPISYPLSPNFSSRLSPPPCKNGQIDVRIAA